MGNLIVDEDTNRDWESIKGNIKTSAKVSLGLHELKQHNPWFDEECLHFLEQRKQAKMQWVQDPSQRNVDNLNTVRAETSRHFRNKKKAHLKAKTEELGNNSKIKNTWDLYRCNCDFNPLKAELHPICHFLALLAHYILHVSMIRVKKGYQPRINIVKNEKGDLIADSYSIVASCRNSFFSY